MTECGEWIRFRNGPKGDGERDGGRDQKSLAAARNRSRAWLTRRFLLLAARLVCGADASVPRGRGEGAAGVAGLSRFSVAPRQDRPSRAPNDDRKRTPFSRYIFVALDPGRDRWSSVNGIIGQLARIDGGGRVQLLLKL